ncbi:MAG TPA: triose-phosphate isomerase [Caulobacteraceae bacterium]|jgi:triosephosphate isomerase|nr:triose-phosphate isomerase [Caulobacteraceae bacterium]
MPESSSKLIVGNWKMNGLAGGLEEAGALAEALEAQPARARVALCPPATLIAPLARLLEGTAVEVGAQDCHPLAGGAFTGDLSAEMLHAAGARLVILGHSERRAGHQETDADVAAKVEAALRAGVEPIVCVGESLEQRKAGRALGVVRAQVRGSLPAALKGRAFSVAYEPIWAIGTGLTPTVEEIEAVHAEIRHALAAAFGEAFVPILYGGSVKPENAAAILHAAEVGGALVGGASLKCADFLPIVRAAG